MAFDVKDLEAIEAAIASGTNRVHYKDRDITYTSLADLLRAREIIKDELGIGSKRRFNPVHWKGV